MNMLNGWSDRSKKIAIAGGFLVCWVSAAEAVLPGHLSWAEAVALNVLPARNDYATNPSYIYWKGVNGALDYQNRTECASFVTLNLRQAYGWSTTFMKNWMGSTSPFAATYHDTIVAQNGFLLVPNVQSIASGDIIAIKYPAGLTATGHTMIADGPAVLRAAATGPLVAGTLQYEIAVIDSSQSGHGPLDTRYYPNGTWEAGAGRGVLRLYADRNGLITGYTWSTYTNSVYYDQASRHLVVGRLNK